MNESRNASQEVVAIVHVEVDRPEHACGCPSRGERDSVPDENGLVMRHDASWRLINIDQVHWVHVETNAGQMAC
ncbi:MAG: hypothetical protein P8R42_24745 [Candidatus Binatia bacterium]|nr:hypothetical protein [Candidatus Binatia bacterium]